MEENVFFRLKNERIRKKVTQKMISDVTDVSIKTVGRWEKEVPIPSDKLSKLVDLGLDVAYILTGIRTPQVELDVTQKLNTAIEQAVAEGNFEGAKNLKHANEAMQTARTKRAENYKKREDEIRQIVFCLLEMDDATFERTENMVKDVWVANRSKL